MKKRNIFLAIISMILLFQIPANAQKRWIGTASANWNNAANWLPAGVPIATTDVIIEEGNIVPALNALQSCNITAGAICRSIVGITNSNFNFVIGANTLTVLGDVNSSGGFGEVLFTMSPTSVVVINGNFNDTNSFLLDSPLGTVRFEGTTSSSISLNPSSFGNMTVNKTGIAIPVVIDATDLNRFVSITLQSGTLQTGAPAPGVFLAKLNVITGNSAISIAGASDLFVTNVEVFGGTCTIDPTDQIAVFGNWTQSGVGTVIQTAANKFISFRGGVNGIISSTVANPIDIQANVQILKTAPAKVTITQSTTIGTTVANKNLLVQTGTLVLALPVPAPVTINGNLDIISTGVLDGSSSQTIIALTGNFSSNLAVAPVPFIISLGAAETNVTFIGTTNSLINVSNTTLFNNINVNKSGPTVKVTPVFPSIIRVETTLSIISGTFVAINATDAVTNRPAISAISNPLHRTLPLQRVPPSPTLTLTINGLTGETVDIPNPDIIVRKDVIIASGASLDLGTNEPQANDASTIAIHIGQNLNDANSQLPSNGATIVPVLDANNASYPVNPGTPRGLYIGLSTTRPMGVRSNCTNTNGPVPYAAGLFPRSNFEIPTIVFFSSLTGSIVGNITALPDLCNNFNQGNGISLPNVIMYKTDVSPATIHSVTMDIPSGQNMRINGNFTILVGTFKMNSRLLLFGDYAGKEGTQAQALAEDDKISVYGIFDMGVGSTLLMNTGAEERGTFIRVRKGGYFKSVGTSANPNKITREGTPGQYYRFCIYNGGGIASFRTEHTFMSGRSDDSFATSADENTQPAVDPIVVTKSPNYDLLVSDSNIATETGDGSGHGWIDSRGGLKVLWGAIVNPENTSTVDPEYISVDHNFSYATFGSGGPGATSLTINTGQELDIYGSFFGNNSGTSKNVAGNSRVYFNDVTSTNPANVNVITFKGTLGPIGGAAGEQFDGGKNDQDIAPLYDLIKWETYANIYWVGDYNGTTVPVAAQAAVPPFIPATPAIPTQPFRNATGEGAGSPLEYVAGTGTVNETHAGSTTAWNNPKNWSLSNRSYYNPYQIFPGQATPAGYPKKINSANPSGLAPAFGAGGSIVPSDTLEKFEVQITRTAPSNPTMNVANLTVDGSVIVNSGVFKDYAVFQIRTANSRDAGGIWQKRMARADIIPQLTDAQQNLGTQKILTIATGNILNIGGDLQIQVNGSVSAAGTSNIKVKGNIEAVSNLAFNDHQPPANGNPASNNNNQLNDTDILPAGTSPALVININQINFNATATLTMNGIGGQQIRVARNPLHNLVIDKVSGEVTVQGLNTDARNKMNLTGNLSVLGGKFTMLSTCPLLVNGDIILNPTTSPANFKFNSSAVTVRGNWTNSGVDINAGTGRINFHPNSTATRTITSNNQNFPSVHFGFFDDLTNSGNSYHLDALPENYPSGTPSNPLGAGLVGATTYIIQDNFTATGLTTIYNNRTVSTLLNATVPVRLSGLKILSGATLDLKAGAELLIDASPASPLFSVNSIISSNNSQAGKTRTLLVQEGGTLLAVGTASKFVKISRNGSIGFYRFIVEGTIQARFFLFEFMDFKGVDLSGLTSATDGAGPTNNSAGVNGANITNTSGILGTTDPNGKGVSTNITAALGSFSDGIFTNGESVAGATYLRLPDNYAQTSPVFIERTNFPLATAGSNVSRIATNNVATDFRFSTGIFSGETFDNENVSPAPLAPDGHIRWVDVIKRWDGRSTVGVPTLNNNWNNAANWEGDVVPLASDEVRLDFLGANLDPLYATGVRAFIVDVNVASACQSLAILPQAIPAIRPITLNINQAFTVGSATGGDFSAAVNSTINVNATGPAINISGSWSNDGVFNSNNVGTVTFGPNTGTRVIKAGTNANRNNAFFNIVFANGTTELNSTLFVDNNLTINSGATLDASIGNSSIVLQGNWADAGLFNPRFGRVTFAGGLTPLLNKAQTLTKTGTPTFESFWELRIAKGDTTTFAPSAFDVTLLGSRVLVGESGGVRGGSLLLLNGKFITASGTTPSTGTQMILTDKTSWIRQTGASGSSGFVQGPLGRIFSSNTSEETANFPIGKGTSYLAGANSGNGQIILGLILDQPTRTTFTVEQMNANPEAFGAGTRALPTGINQVSSTRWWDVKNIDFPTTLTPSASFKLIEQGQITIPFVAIEEQPVPATIYGVTYGNGGGETALNASLIGQTSVLQDFDTAIDAPLNARGILATAATTTEIRRGFAPQEGTEWRDLGGIVDLLSPTTGVTSSSNFKTLGNGQFTFGFFFLPLPVELLDLKAEMAGEKIRVSWITVSEKNNDYFIVEKSIDAKSFEEVGRVPAKTTTSALNMYEIFDANPYQTINYYRLKQFDKNGKFTYSKIISIKMGKTSASNLSIYPNPTTNNEFMVDLKGTDLAGAQVTVTDMLGKTVYTTKIDQNGTNQLIRPNTTLAAGIYVVTVQTSDKVYQQRLSVK